MKSSLLWIVIVGLAGTTGWQVYRNQALQDRLGDVEAQLATRAASTSTKAKRLPTLESTVLPRRIEGLQSQVAELREEMARVASAAVAKADATDASMTADGALAEKPQFREAVREIMLDLTDDIVFRQKLGGQVGKLDLGKHAAFSKLADTLKLDATQEEKFRQDLMGLKEDVMLMLTQERDDGKDIMGEIQKAEGLGENDPKRTKIFMQLFQLKVPGTEDTYWNRVIEYQGAFRKRTDNYLRTEQVEIFNAIKVDLLSVEVE